LITEPKDRKKRLSKKANVSFTGFAFENGADPPAGETPKLENNLQEGWAKTSPREKLTRVSSRILSDNSLSKMFNRQNPRDVYAFMDKIGKGGFSSVYTAKNRKTTQVVAIKVLTEKFEVKEARLCNEIRLLASCKSSNILHYIESFLYNEDIYVVTEYCDAGTLERLLKVDLSEKVIGYILEKVLNGLCHLHSRQRVHRDIKSANIFVDSSGAVKIGDLGLCVELGSEEFVDGKMSGSKYWLAPEVIARKPYGYAVDIWGVGCLGFAMSNRAAPYSEMHAIKAMYLVGVQGVSVVHHLKKGMSQSFRDFLSLCFQMDPKNRPSASELLQHPFIKDAGTRADLCTAVKSCVIVDNFFVA